MTTKKTKKINNIHNNIISKPSFMSVFAMVGIPTILLYIATQIVIPILQQEYLFPIEVNFFISVALLVYIPIFLASVILAGKEIERKDLQSFCQRMRIKSILLVDWGYIIGAFILVMILSVLLMKTSAYIPHLNTSLPFMDSMPLQSNTYWILAVWLPFFFFNILGEELWWRGYIQPKLELLTPKYAWFMNGVFWGIFHFGMGWSTIFLALPMFLILPFVVQLRKNTTIGIVLHALFGALGILSHAFGVAS